MSETQEAARHSCGFFIAQHGRLLPAGVWEHPCEQIAAIDARVNNARPAWWVRLVSRLRAAKETDER